MGLLELLQNGETQLSAGSFPNDTPINDPQSGFVQENSYDLPYESFGQPNNGSVLIDTLDNTALDNTDNSEPTTGVLNPAFFLTDYSYYARGRWKASALQFFPTWAPGYTYLDNYSSVQPSTLSQTSLDNTLNEYQSTTDPVPNANSYPNEYPYVSPQTGMGMFGFGAGQYNINYSWAGGYYSQNNYDSIINNSDNNLVSYTPQSGLSIDNNGTAAFIQAFPFNQTYLGDPGYPEFVTGNWGQNPHLFNQYYTPNYNYLSEVQNFGGYHGEGELNRTSLDNTNPNNYSGIVPDSINAPNDYPLLVTGDWNSAPSQYESPYNANNTYLDNVSIQSQVSPQRSSLIQTGLDNDYSPHEPTTITPTSVTYPNDYPALSYVNMGEFNGAPVQYSTPYSSISSYLSQYTALIDVTTNPQLSSLTQTGLDVEQPESAQTTFTVPAVDNITVYPAQNVTGVTGSAPQGFTQTWNPTSEYYSFMKSQYQAH